ncbi:MAG: T9SS type A sorting domain-containing protein [bacterium]
MKRLITLLLLVLVLGVSASQAQWSSLPAMPDALSWSMNVQVDGTLYVIGGLNNAGAVSTFYTYKPGDAAWKKLSVTLPTGRVGGVAGVVNGKIYITGGVGISGNSVIPDNSTLEYDPVAGTLGVKKSIPNTANFSAGATINGKIYVVDGCTKWAFTTSGDLNLVQIYDPATDTWANSTTLPPFTNRLAGVTTQNGKIYLMGGMVNNGQQYNSDVWEGTPSGNDVSWKKAGVLPAPYMQGTAGSVGGSLIFTAAYGATAVPNSSNTFISADNGATWTKTYSLPIVTYNCGALLGSGNDLYLAGGAGSTATFKFTLSEAKLPYGSLSPVDIFVNLSQNDTRDYSTAVGNFGIAPLNVTVNIPDSMKSWVSTTGKVTVSALGSSSYSLHLMAGTMTAGLYRGTVTINTDDPKSTNIKQNITLYVLPNTITPQTTNVVLEGATGNWCGYCPQGTEIIENQIKPNFPDNLISIEYHMGPGYPSTDPLHITAGENLILAMEPAGTIGAPLAAAQRWLIPGLPSQATDRNYWPSMVQYVVDNQPNAPVAITVTAYSFDKTTRKLHAVLTFDKNEALLTKANTTINLTTVVTEDGLAGQQEDYRLPSPYWKAFIWNDIARQVYPNEFGTVIPFPKATMVGGNVEVPGDKATLTVDLTVPNTIKKDSLKNCNVNFLVSYITNGNTFGDMLQGMKIPLLSPTLAVETPNPTAVSLEQNFPNPVSSETTIEYSLSQRSAVTLTVYDVLGREVAHLVNSTEDAGKHAVDFDAARLTPGTYIYSLSVGGKSFEKTMVVTK